MNVIAIVRVCAVVGLSAMSFISSMLKVRDQRDGGLINRISAFCNSSDPYNCNTGDVNMYNNAYGSTSRRYGIPTQQPMMAGPMMGQPNFMRPLSFNVASYQPSQQLQYTLNQYGYNTPGYNAIGQPQGFFGNAPVNMNWQNPMNYSRRNMNVFTPQFINAQFQQQPMTYIPQQQPQPQPYITYGYGYAEPQPQQQQQMNTGAWWQPYNVPVNNDGVQSLYQQCNNNWYGYGYGYAEPVGNQMMYQQPQQYSSFNNINQVQPRWNPEANFDGWMNGGAGFIGCCARQQYWVPDSNSSPYAYGYDDNAPSYHVPAYASNMNYGYNEQQMQQQMMMQQQIQQQMMAQQQMMNQRPVQVPQQTMGGSLSERAAFYKANDKIRPFDTNNAWMNVDDFVPQSNQNIPSFMQSRDAMNELKKNLNNIGSGIAPQPQQVPPPAPQQQSAPNPANQMTDREKMIREELNRRAMFSRMEQQQQQAVATQEPKQDSTKSDGIDVGALFERECPPDDLNGRTLSEALASIPAPTHVMTFGSEPQKQEEAPPSNVNIDMNGFGYSL